MPLPEQLAILHPVFLGTSFILGCLFGSFGNVCVARWPAGESVVSPRSRCPKCKNAIAWYDNIPILSWLALGAKCRHCGQPIHWQYPLVELLTGLLFLAVYWRFGLTLATPVYMGLAWAMVVVTFQDFADWTIPDAITIPGIFVGLGLAVIGMIYPASDLRMAGELAPLHSFFGILLGGGFLFLLDFITVRILKKPGMGLGDVKLLAMLGAFIGWKGVIFTIVAASLFGSVIGLGMIAYFRLFVGEDEDEETESDRSGKEAGHAKAEESDAFSDEAITLQGHYLPFGPYLALGGLLYVFVGPEFIAWYASTFIVPPTDPILLTP